MSIGFPLGTTILAVGLAALLPVRGAAVMACAVPEELKQVDAGLPHLRRQLDRGGPIRIIALGGASTAGIAAGSPDRAYPARLRAALTRRYPDVAITVINRGVARQSAEQMLRRFSKDVFPQRPALVIWETGISDAVRGTEIDDFADALQTGIDLLKARKIDVILVDMQYSKGTSLIINFDDYLNTIHHVGDFNGVYVFPRFQMMRYWSEHEVYDFESGEKGSRAALAAQVYRCIGLQLADAIHRAAQ